MRCDSSGDVGTELKRFDPWPDQNPNGESVPFTLLLFVALTWTPAGSIGQCVIFDKPEELWDRSDLVFLGTVISTKPTGADGSHVTVDIATFRVDRAWKGKPEATVHVGGDAFFLVGTQYLVFAVGKPPSTSLPCRWAEPAERAQAKLAWLSKRRTG